MTEFTPALRRLALALALLAAAAGAPAQERVALRNGDYIVAVVNQELVTAVEVEQRLAQIRAAAARGGQRLPPLEQLRAEVLSALIDERVVVTHARETGLRIDDTELERAVQNVAAQNQLTPDQLRERLQAQGMDYARFRASLRDQILMERVREREVIARIRVDEEEIDAAIAAQRGAAAGGAQLNIAQILVTVPDGADAETVAARRARAAQAVARVRAGEPFEAVARELSEDANRERGGVIGLRPAARLPDLFVEATRAMTPGEVSAEPVRSGAGFHVLKLLERVEPEAFRVTETRARHILLRASQQLSAELAAQRLADYRRQIEAGTRRFEDVAREISEDGSAAQGGDLGWSQPGMMVPEFEAAMNRLPPGGLSPPVVSRFGVHLIQVLERRETSLDPRRLRDLVRGQLREQKFEAAYLEWSKDLRARAYIEMREPPT
jgi:peptidyl-prolyl cis-trans isomerase SurA